MTEVRRVLAGPPVDGIDDFVDRGGGKGLVAARHQAPESIIALIEQSGLRGRGGAGFPTGTKLRSVAAALHADSVRHVIVNAAEGEPGTFKDRAILRHNPYEVIEGACIAAVALGASDIVIATKSSFEHEVDRLTTAVGQLEGRGVIEGFRVRVVEGPSEYLYGEETALLEVIDGRPPFPRVAPPYRRGIEDGGRAESGATWTDGAAVFVSNVETYANLPGILRHEADWFRSCGSPLSPGTIMCTVTGDTVRHGVAEVALGSTVREVIEQIGGGVPSGRRIIAVLNGVSNPPLGPDQLDTPLTYEDMSAIGSGLGSASFIVVDDTRSLHAVAAEVARFLSIESCGQCEPCKRDGLTIAAALRGDTHAFRPGEDLDTIVADRLSTVARGARCALAGQQERVVGGLVEMARTFTATPVADDVVVAFRIAPIVDIVNGRARLDLAHVDKRPDWTYAGEDPDSHAWPADRLVDHPVRIGRTHLAESADLSDGTVPEPSVASPDAFEALRAIEACMEDDIAALRRAPVAERGFALLDLRRNLDRHQRVTERLVYPLVRLMVPDDGDDLAWYPQHHEEHASRLLRRLDLGTIGLSGYLVDELCADVHASIIELQRRVLPLIEKRLDEDGRKKLQVESGVAGLLDD